MWMHGGARRRRDEVGGRHAAPLRARAGGAARVVAGRRIVGYSLGGGIGWLARKHGMQANAVTAIEL